MISSGAYRSDSRVSQSVVSENDEDDDAHRQSPQRELAAAEYLAITIIAAPIVPITPALHLSADEHSSIECFSTSSSRVCEEGKRNKDS